MRIHVPIRLPSLANTRLHWRAKLRIKHAQQTATRLCLLTANQPKPTLPAVVTITRIGPRRLDDDNLAACAKFVRDTIAAWVGTDDGSPLYTWRYEQRAGKYGVDIDITARGT